MHIRWNFGYIQFLRDSRTSIINSHKPFIRLNDIYWLS